MTELDLSRWRARVLERAINLEWLISATICQYYFSHVPWNFITEVLYDEQCSFGLKCNVLEKLLTPPRKGFFNDLRRLGRIRNHFAHCGPHVATPERPEGFVLDPKRPHAILDLGAMFTEFEELSPVVERELLSAFKSMGGVVSCAPPSRGA